MFLCSRPVKFATFIDESIRKNKSITSSHWVFKILIIRFSCRSISFEVFKEAILFSFTFKCDIYVQRTPWGYFIGEFRSIRRWLLYQFYLARNKTAEIMGKLCEVGPKSLRKNFWVKEIFFGTKCFLLFPGVEKV